MADNLELNAGTGGATLAADDIAGIHHQRVKVQYGVDGAATDVSDTNPMPVDDAGGSLTVDNGGTFAVQVDGDALTALQLIDDAVHADDAAFTLGTSKGVVVMGFAGTQSVNANDAAALACDTDGALHIADGGNSITVDGTVDLGATDNAVLDSIVTNTAKGASHYRNIDANAEAAIKASAGTLHWIHAMNMTAAVAYLHLYDDTTTNVNPGTTTPNFTFPIPTQGDTNGAGFVLRLEQAFANAITLVVTTTTDGSAGDPGTNGVFVNAGYT